MKIFFPAIGQNDVKIFEVQGLIYKRHGEDDEIIVTGYVDDIVIEQVYLAYSIYCSNNDSPLLDKNQVLHIHFCDYSSYKEGSSCALALYILLLSLGCNNQIKKSINVCATGELDLYGYVHEVGGIDEKYKASRNSNIDFFLSPTLIEEEKCFKIGHINDLEIFFKEWLI